MFAIPGILALVFLIYVRPQEFWKPLEGIPFLYAFLFLAIYGQILDLKLRVSKPTATPQLLAVIAFFAWGVISMALFEVPTFTAEVVVFTTAMVLYFTPAHAVQSFKMLNLVAGLMLAISLFLSAVAIHQARASKGCILLDPTQASNVAVGAPDGRPCQLAYDCYLGDPEPGGDYLCERIGLFGTFTVADRARYRGILQDPNELALALAITVPFAFAFYEQRRSGRRRLLLLATLVLVGTACYFTRSRGGQLVLAAALGVYFVRRFKLRGAILGAVLAAALLAVGGRGGVEAEKSTLERLEAWYEGMTMFRQSPLIGVGMTQFTEHHWLTAHNSYILAVAELGLVGFFLWSAVLYLSVKIPLMILWHYKDEQQARVARTWAFAFLASWIAALLGIGLLSFTYHFVLWLLVGLTGALYSAVRIHDPSFRVRFRLFDLAAVAFLDAGLVTVFYLYTRLRPPT